MNKKRKLYLEILYIVFIFFVGALLGGTLEILYKLLTMHKFSIGGFMYGPFRPIYGWGVLILYFTGETFKKNNFTIFLSSAIICSIFEYISSYILELLFHHKWWDYSNFFLNINGRVCLLNTIFWGILGLAFMKIIEPKLSKFYLRANKKILLIILIAVFFIFKIDGIISFSHNLSRWK